LVWVGGSLGGWLVMLEVGGVVGFLDRGGRV
jgi:hypothetical protein